MDLFDRVMELSRYGYFCGQILAKLLLETIGEAGSTAESASPAAAAAA